MLLPAMGLKAPEEEVAVLMGVYQENPAVLSSGFRNIMVLSNVSIPST